MGRRQIRLIREAFGFILILAYLIALPPLFAKKWFKRFYTTLGPIRFHVMMFLLLTMAALADQDDSAMAFQSEVHRRNS